LNSVDRHSGPLSRHSVNLTEMRDRPKAYVINLDRMPERKASIEQELAKTGIHYEVMSAVDSRQLDQTDTSLVVPDGLIARRGHWPSVAACSLSHLAAYRRVLEEDLPGALILEDDVSVPDDLVELTERVALTAQGASLVLYGYGRKRAEHPVLLSSHGAIAAGSRSLLSPIDVENLRGATGYYITAEACRRMVDNLLPITAPADEWVFFYEQRWVDDIRCVSPRAVHSKPFPSSIGYSGSRYKGLVKEAMERTVGLREVVKWRRRRLQAFWTKTQVVDAASPLAKGRKSERPDGVG
jgi:glycosyl transferase family 25